MTLQEVVGYVSGDGTLAFPQHLQIGFSELGGDFVADVQELPEMRVLPWVRCIVPERQHVLFRTPPIYGLG